MPHETTIGNSSLAVICTDSQEVGQCNRNQSPDGMNAPQPHPPDAPDVTTVRLAEQAKVENRATPFQPSRNKSHHIKSERKAALKRTWWWSSLRVETRSIIRLRKVRPGRTTRKACCRCPIKDNNSRLVHDLRQRHAQIITDSRCSLAGGNFRTLARVSTSMPRNSRVVLGPSVFWEVIGTPSLRHKFRAVSRA